MKTQTLVHALEDATEQLGVRVRREKGNFRGGLCKVGTERVVMLNKRQPPEQHVTILAESLRNLPIDTIFLKPAVRKALTTVWERRATSSPDAEEVG